MGGYRESKLGLWPSKCFGNGGTAICLAPQTIILPYFRDIISQRNALYPPLLFNVGQHVFQLPVSMSLPVLCPIVLFVSVEKVQ